MSQPRNDALAAAVLIVEDQAPMRAALRDLIQQSLPKIPVIDAPNGATALKLFDAHRPAFVLMDVRLPDANGVDLTHTIKQRCPVTMVAVTSVETNAHLAAQARAAGATAFIGKDDLFDQIVPLIRAAVSLRVWIDHSARGEALGDALGNVVRRLDANRA